MCLCIVLSLMLSRALYFVMAILQWSDVCLAMILCASALAFLPMLAMVSIDFLCSVGFVGRGGMLMFLIDSGGLMFGWLWRYVWGSWQAALIAFWTLWCIVSWCFHSFCCSMGKNHFWSLAPLGSGVWVVSCMFVGYIYWVSLGCFESYVGLLPIVFEWGFLGVVYVRGLLLLGFAHLGRLCGSFVGWRGG